jgi:hypothetical protein
MFRRTVLPLALLGLAAAALAGAAWGFEGGRDLAGLYFAAVAVTALRAGHRIAIVGTEA